MSAQTDLFQTYQDWRDFSQLEQQAIEQSDWARVDSCQDRKAQLQLTISQLSERTEAELQGRPKWLAFQRELRPLLEELVALERRNSQLLAAKRAHAEECADPLNRNSSTLRQVRKSCGMVRGPGWSRYS